MAATLQLLPIVEEQRPALSDGMRMGAIGVGVLVLAATLYYFGSKFVSAQLPKVQKVRGMHKAELQLHFSILGMPIIASVCCY